MNNIDLALSKNTGGIYDISFTDGDFTKMTGYDTAILLSLTCERRALESEVKIPQYRRGWWGNEANGYDNFEYGSKLWLLDQTRATQNTLNDSRTYANDSLQWMPDDNEVDAVLVDSEYNSEMELIINIQFVRNNDKTLSRSYNLWQNTFIRGEI